VSGPATTSTVSPVRGARVSDAATVADLLDELGYLRQSVAEAARRLRILLDDEQHLILVVEADRTVVGLLHAHYCAALAVEPFVEIMALIVTEANRGAGLGGALVEAGAEWARGLGVDEVCVRARVERLRAPAFYRTHGFFLDKRQNVFVCKLSVQNGRP
jgi:N-acetylglutamate synthase-like GNAT family acetyltransferase